MSSPVESRGRGWSPERKWALVRLALGGLQMFGATVSLVLLAQLGVTAVTLGFVVVTSFSTTVSVLLFGRRH